MSIASVSLVLPCYAGCCWSSFYSQQSWVGQLVASLRWNLLLRRESFRSVSVQGLLGPLSEVHGDLSSKNLPSTSRVLPRVKAIHSNVSGVSWETLTNNSKEGFSCLVLGILLDGLWLLGTWKCFNVKKEGTECTYCQNACSAYLRL